MGGGTGDGVRGRGRGQGPGLPVLLGPGLGHPVSAPSVVPRTTEGGESCHTGTGGAVAGT